MKAGGKSTFGEGMRKAVAVMPYHKLSQMLPKKKEKKKVQVPMKKPKKAESSISVTKVSAKEPTVTVEAMPDGEIVS